MAVEGAVQDDALDRKRGSPCWVGRIQDVTAVASPRMKSNGRLGRGAASVLPLRPAGTQRRARACRLRHGCSVPFLWPPRMPLPISWAAVTNSDGIMMMVVVLC